MGHTVIELPARTVHRLVALRSGLPGLTAAVRARLAAAAGPVAAQEHASISRLVGTFIASTVLLGVLAQIPVYLSVSPFPSGSWKGLVLLVALILLAEMFAADIDPRSTMSASCILMIGGAYVYGVVGIVVVVLAFVVGGKIDSHSPLHRVVFNFGNVLFACACAVWLLWWLAAPFTGPSQFAGLLLPAVLAGMVYYVTHTAMISLVRGLDEQRSPIELWRANFLWLWPYYLLVSVIAAFVAATAVTFGWIGIAALVAPVAMAQLGIRQRVRAESELRELNATLEQRVAERTAELQAANRDLESFAYSVSHDLRAPLRAISGFTRMLVEEHAETLPGEARGYLDRVSQNSVKLSELIEALLTFSRLGRANLSTRVVDPAILVTQVLDELAPVQDERQVDVTVGTLPQCSGDPTLLRLVFMNLLDNALKFTRDRDPARIEVGWQAEEGEPGGVYYVRDNGAGFDMRYADRLFGVFQRLHSSKQFEGTGIGLANVQRIVQRHGGRIWAQAEVDRGATFFFTIGATRRDTFAPAGMPAPPA